MGGGHAAGAWGHAAGADIFICREVVHVVVMVVVGYSNPLCVVVVAVVEIVEAVGLVVVVKVVSQHPPPPAGR